MARMLLYFGWYISMLIDSNEREIDTDFNDRGHLAIPSELLIAV